MNPYVDDSIKYLCSKKQWKADMEITYNKTITHTVPYIKIKLVRYTYVHFQRYPPFQEGLLLDVVNPDGHTKQTNKQTLPTLGSNYKSQITVPRNKKLLITIDYGYGYFSPYIRIILFIGELAC